MTQRHTAARLSLAAALGAGLLLVPATMAQAHDVETCEVTGGTLTWGVLERWRSYVSGAIAYGEYTPIAPATYEIPNFIWHNGSGEVDAHTGEATLSFEGGANFTGHDGELNTTFSNPTFVIDAEGNTKLLLDVDSLGRQGAADTQAKQAELAEFGNVGTVDPESGSIVLEGVEGALTAAAEDVFSAYDAGEPVDPITINVTVDCAIAEAAPAPEADAQSADSAADATAEAEAEEDGLVTTQDEAQDDDGYQPWHSILIIIGILALAWGGNALYGKYDKKKKAAAEAKTAAAAAAAAAAAVSSTEAESIPVENASPAAGTDSVEGPHSEENAAPEDDAGSAEGNKPAEPGPSV